MASLHGYEIECDRTVERLSEAPGELGSVRVRAAVRSPLERSGELLAFVEGRDGLPRYGLARTGSRLVAWNADAGSFAIDPEAMSVSYRTDDAVRPEGELRWGDRLGSTAIPLLAAELGGLALHASANRVDGRSLLICGVTGRGKSTLTAALAARGHPSLAEDGVVVHQLGGGHFVWPGMVGALLTETAVEAIGAISLPAGGAPDSRGRLLASLPTADGRMEVGAVAILAEREGATVAVERLSPARAHRELIAQAVAGGRAGRRSFSGGARLAERTPVALVRVPDRIDAVAEAAEELASFAAVE
jgi:hypothetical protein